MKFGSKLPFFHAVFALRVGHSYTNSTAVTEQVNRIKSRPNLLLWYTADEPNGQSEPHNSTVIASNIVSSLAGGDGQGGVGYHPVSLVLNCKNYYFTYVNTFSSCERCK